MKAFFACYIMQLFSVVFCVVRAVHNFDRRIVKNETVYERRPVERRTETSVFDRIFVFTDSRREC